MSAPTDPSQSEDYSDSNSILLPLKPQDNTVSLTSPSLSKDGLLGEIGINVPDSTVAETLALKVPDF
jgi:hypothetical protein